MSPYTITIYDEDNVAEDEMILSALRRVTIFASSGRFHKANIYVEARKPNGWCEYIVHSYFDKEDKTPLVVGVIQRHVGASIEWHS